MGKKLLLQTRRQIVRGVSCPPNQQGVWCLYPPLYSPPWFKAVRSTSQAQGRNGEKRSFTGRSHLKGQELVEGSGEVESACVCSS